MKEKKLLALFGSVCLILVLAVLSFMACAKPAPTPTPPPPPPPEEEKPTPAPEPFELTIHSLPAGYSAYALGVGLAALINKHSTWLKATAIEGRGPTEALRKLVNEPERRKDFLFFNTPWELWCGENQIGVMADFPFDYDEFRYVSLVGLSSETLVTCDRNIKTLEDLRGKRVVVSSRAGDPREIQFKGIFKAAGILDEVKFEYMTGKPATDALRDGLIDACIGSMSLWEPPDTWVLAPYTMEVVETKDVYLIPIPEEYIKAMMEETGFPSMLSKIPAGLMGPLQTEPAMCLSRPNVWSAHIDMPDRVVTEMLRIIYENADKFKEYTPAGAIITKETMATMSASEEQLHAAALKFYKEKAIPITSFE